MFGALSRAFDRFRGGGEAAVTIPSMDGAFRPNERLEQAPTLLDIDSPDNLAANGSRILFSSDAKLLALQLGQAVATAQPLVTLESTITCLDVCSDGGVAVGLARGAVILRGGTYDGRQIDKLDGRALMCPTSVRFLDADNLVICLGSQQHDPTEWKRDLLKRNASGSVWRIDLPNGTSTCLADGLAWPNGVIASRSGRLVVAESWRHQILDLAKGKASPLLSELPGYPARMSAAEDGGYWLAVFAPRSQLVEFVLREPRFRDRMMLEVEPEFWIAPSLHHMIDYREPLQSGAIKQLGELKPWAPSRSYGLVVRLDQAFKPIASMHSRANGNRHGITSCLQLDGYLLAASKGGSAILQVQLEHAAELTA
jgi:hypothetical protein